MDKGQLQSRWQHVVERHRQLVEIVEEDILQRIVCCMVRLGLAKRLNQSVRLQRHCSCNALQC